MLFLAFSEIQSRDFLAVSPIPGLRSGSNAKAFSILTYPGLLYRPLLSELCFAIPDELNGKFADMIWLILAQVSTCAHDVAKSRRMLEPALQVQRRRKFRQGWPIFYPRVKRQSELRSMNDGAQPGGLPSQCQNPEAAMLAQSENSFEGLQGKTPGLSS